METPSSSAGQGTTTERSNREFADAAAAAAAAEDPWLISVKTVGGGIELLSNCTGSGGSGGGGSSSSTGGNSNNSNSADDDDENDKQQGTTPASSGECQFTVQVFPEDRLESLHDQIEASTGLKASQQRLIYRGRLISSIKNGDGATVAPPPPASASDKNHERDDGTNSNANSSSNSENNPKIKDIAGLAHGQTIHLVKRRETPEPASSSDQTTPDGDEAPREGELFGSLSARSGSAGGGGGGGGGLLAALLGLSSLSDEPSSLFRNNDGDNDDETAATATRLRGRRGGTRLMNVHDNTSRSLRRMHHRLTAEDRRVPDPGSLEPVRQGLLTLHTLLPHLQSGGPEASGRAGSGAVGSSSAAAGAAISTDYQVAANYTSPLQANREWYRGQWLDVLDTVNQWLEATVVEIVRPHEILPPSTNETVTQSRPRRWGRSPHLLPRDTAVSASDLEGRRRLLLEPCARDDEDSLGGELAGFRPRSTNEGVQLLLIHYNGWPHRWDEWIRSDSERLRPFRTRTRHPTMSSTTSPSPQSIFHESPRTNIFPHGDNDAEDRMGLLPELARAMAAVNRVLQQQVAAATGVSTTDLDITRTAATDGPMSRRVNPDLPWGSFVQPIETSSVVDSPDVLVPPAEGEETSNILRPYYDASSELVGDSEDDDNAFDVDNLDEPVNMNAILEDLFDSSNDHHQSSSISNAPQYNSRELHNLAILLDRLGRTLTDAAPQVASLADNLPSNHPEENDEDEDSDEMYEEAVEQALEEIAEGLQGSETSSSETGMGGLLSLWSRERRRSRAGRRTAVNLRSFGRGGTSSSSSSTVAASNPAVSMVDPDYEDYVGGLVNTTRGEVRVGPRSRSSNEDMANLLGAYLTAATLGSATNLGDGEGGEEHGGNGGGLGHGLGQLLRGGTTIGGAGGGGGGIDIHIHAVVTAPGMLPGGVGITTLGGGGGGGTTVGTTGLGTTRNLFSSTRRAGMPGSILRSSRPSTSSLLSSRRRSSTNAGVEDDEDLGLFAELYSETPDPIDPNGSSTSGERTSGSSYSRHATLPSRSHYRGEEEASDYIASRRSANATSSNGGGRNGNSFRRETERPAEILSRTSHRTLSPFGARSHLDPSNVGAAHIAGRSTTRRRSAQRSLRRESSADRNHGGDNNSTLQHTTSASPRQSSGWGRLFRRRASAQDP